MCFVCVEEHGTVLCLVFVPTDVAVASIAVKEKGRASILKGAYCSHPLFIFIDSDAFRAYWFSFHSIEGFAFDGVLAVLCDRNIHLNIVFLNVQTRFEH